MLRISTEQVDFFSRLRREDFFQRTAKDLRGRFPQECADMQDDGLVALLQKAVDCGRRYGVTSGYDVRRFAECLLTHGADFPVGHRHCWARVVLEDPNIDGRSKMNALIEAECFAARTWD